MLRHARARVMSDSDDSAQVRIRQERPMYHVQNIIAKCSVEVESFFTNFENIYTFFENYYQNL